MSSMCKTRLLFVAASLFFFGVGCGEDGQTAEGANVADLDQDLAVVDGLDTDDPDSGGDIVVDAACVSDCGKKQCGPDGCGGTCGTCGTNAVCSSEGVCEATCVAQCAEKECGPDGCGGLCGQCDAGETCNEGACVSGPKPDCQEKECGPDGVGGVCGACEVGFECNPDGRCIATCIPDCNGKACGDDGCGASCGECGVGFTCGGGRCMAVCVPDCDGKACGDDGCGSVCGVCDVTQICSSEGLCESACQPDCTGKVCGDDGCGNACGACDGEAVCTDGQCVEPCVPDCGGAVCGDDGCGGQCGVCKGNGSCQDGQCVCVPTCENKECGANGCGGLCGICPAGDSCLGSGKCSGSSGPQTCPDVMGCMIVNGCGCQEGVDCPGNFNDAYACVKKCEQDPSCSAKCWGAAPAAAQNNTTAILTCLNTECSVNPAPGDCVENECLGPYAACFALGTNNCAATLDCTAECVDSVCKNACMSDATPSGLSGFIEAANCAADLCKGSSNLTYCENVAMLGICRMEKPECLPQGLGNAPCIDVVLCLTDCPIQDDLCRSDCMNSMGQPATFGVALMVGCMVNECLDDMTPACLQAAVDSGNCAVAWQECSTCDIFSKQSFGPSFVVTKMGIGASGHPGEALNIDPDKGVGDCAPQGNCSAGLDNGLAAFGPFLNPSLEDSLASGALILVGEILGDVKQPFSIPIYTAFDVIDGCDPTAQSCQYYAASFSFDEACMPLVQFDGCTLVGAKLTGGGDTTQIPLPLPVSAEEFLIVTLYRARIVGDATVTSSGVQLTNTLVGGAIRKSDLIIALNSIPGDTLAGIPKSLVLTLVNGVAADVDTDSDNINDAISVGLKVTGEFGKIIGVQ
ncbi:MAG: hypothetical protein HUU55_17670 [Myxococcales bacterium]|nr:hypothetical protein [Myxococcales bacterium]